MARFGYYADLRGVQFSEGNKSWITAMRVGEYSHPAYGKISFTPDRLKRFADSVKDKVRGIALDIDYDHKTDPTKGNEAAGWVEDAKVEGDTLMLLVDWTQSAVAKIKEKAYRYFSPEFQDEWTDSNGKQHRDVLFGGGITNRPFLKDLLPVNLSELTFAEQKKGRGMDPKKLRTSLGLPEDATDEQVMETAAANHQAATTKSQPVDRTATTHAPNNPATDQQGKVGGVPFDATTATSVDNKGNMITPEDVQLNELAKTNPGLAIMLREQMMTNKALAAQVTQLTESNKLNEIRVKLNEYRTGATVLKPVILDEAAKLLAKLPIALHEDVHGLLKLLQAKDGVTVQLGEIGHTSNPTSTGGKTAHDQFEELIQAQRKQFNEASGKELEYSDALLDVAQANPELYAQYREESYSFKA